MHSHTAALDDGRLIDVLALIDRTSARSPVRRSLRTLTAANRLCRSRRSGFSRHRYIAADTRCPVLIDGKNRLIDGRHRLCKIGDLGGKVVRAVVVSDADLCACAA